MTLTATPWYLFAVTYIWRYMWKEGYLACCVEVGTSLEQFKHDVISSFLGGQMQRRQPVLHIASVWFS